MVGEDLREALTINSGPETHVHDFQSSSHTVFHLKKVFRKFFFFHQ